MHGINSVRCLIEVIRLKEYYVTVSAPQLLRRILLIPLGLVALASAIVCFSSIDKLTPSDIVPVMFSTLVQFCCWFCDMGKFISVSGLMKSEFTPGKLRSDGKKSKHTIWKRLHFGTIVFGSTVQQLLELTVKKRIGFVPIQETACTSRSIIKRWMPFGFIKKIAPTRWPIWQRNTFP